MEFLGEGFKNLTANAILMREPLPGYVRDGLAAACAPIFTRWSF